MNAMSKITLAAAGLVMAGQAAAQITFYEREGFDGRSFTTQGQVAISRVPVSTIAPRRK